MKKTFLMTVATVVLSIPSAFCADDREMAKLLAELRGASSRSIAVYSDVGGFTCLFSGSVPADSKQEAFEDKNNNRTCMMDCAMTIGKAVLGNLNSEGPYIRSVTVVDGELLYWGKTYGPGNYKVSAISRKILESCP